MVKIKIGGGSMKLNKKFLLMLIILMVLPLVGCNSASNNGEESEDVKKTKQEDFEEKEQDEQNVVADDEKVEKMDKLTFDNGVQREDGLYELPYELKDGVKEFHLTATEVEWETKEGEFKTAWTYNGIVPGPILKINKGDRIRVILKNELPEATVLHWHGIEVPNNMDGVPGVTQEPIQPGDTFTYEFDVNQAGTHMYHSHMKTIKQVPKGLFGPIVVEDPSEEKATHDNLLVVSDGALGYLINGKSFPDTSTWKAKVGDDMRIRVINIGNQIHPMHLHGHHFTVTHKDGNKKPKTIQFEEDNLEIMPGSTYDITFKARKGTWVFHCHILSHVYDGKGERTGMIQVLQVD